MCDCEGAALIQRTDDTESVFVERLKTFEEQTAPVIAHYRALGRFEEADGDRDVDAVNGAIETSLLDLRNGKRG
jgi:adenylate kinase